MTRLFFIAVACIALIAFSGSCGPNAKSENPVGKDMPKEAKKVQPEKKPALKQQVQEEQTVRHKHIKGRERYEAFASARIRDAENQLEDMKTRAMHSSGRARKRAEYNVRGLEDCIHEAYVNLNKLEKANAKNWEQSKQNMEKTLAKMSRYSN